MAALMLMGCGSSAGRIRFGAAGLGGMYQAFGDAFAKLSEGKTVIMIAHRLSTVANADCIYVIKDGLIAESGRRDELLEKNGVFAEMWKEYAASVEWKVAKEGESNVAR